MKPQYENWINENYPTRESAYGKCSEAVDNMISTFPELSKVRGWVDDAYWGEREHWWCLDTENNIVDPTRKQFPAPYNYRPWDESKGDPPVSKPCLDCGLGFYGEGYFCSKRCEVAYMAYLNGV